MNKRLILASGSPRRKKIMENAGLTFEIMKSSIEEKIDPTLTPSELVQSLAHQKAASIAKEVEKGFVIGADTLVSFQDQILGKPQNQDDAFQMLKQLSGKKHDVLTGVALIHQEKTITFYEKTTVLFWNLNDEEIWDYIHTGEPMDKAGSYGIQDQGAILVKSIHGDYFSVVGLPIARLVRELRKLGFH